MTDLQPLIGDRWVTSWRLDVPALVVVLALAVCYVLALRRHRRNAGERWPVLCTVSFATGLAVLFYVTHAWPAVYGDTLFWVHMLQHLSLIMVAPALLCAGRPLGLVQAASGPVGKRRLTAVLTFRTVSTLTSPPVAVAGYSLVLVVTHLTGLMDKIMVTPWLNQVEHAAYLISGYLLFVPLLGKEPIRWKIGAPSKLVLLGVAMTVDAFVGITLMLQLAPIHTMPHPGWGPSPADDTFLGGAIMWVAGDGIMGAIMVGIVLAWLRRADDKELGSWLGQARASTLAEHVGPVSGGTTDGEVDDDAHLAAYNAWLARLNEAERGR